MHLLYAGNKKTHTKTIILKNHLQRGMINLNNQIDHIMY